MSAEILSRDNPMLLALEADYAKLNMFGHVNWQAYQSTVDIQNFRGEYGYLSQLNYGMTADHYARTYDYLVRLGEEHRIRLLGEDGVFGAITFTSPDGVKYSRDLLDSVFELRFLRETLSLYYDDSDFTLLDVGAGYGRLLHRCSQLYLHSKCYGVDGVPLSTYLCDYYLKYRNVWPGKSIPLGDLNSLNHADIATNCYSFAECSLSTIEFWIRYCTDLGVQYFMIVPHDYGQMDGAFVSHEVDGTNIDYLPLFDKYGYKLMRRQHKYQPREDSHLYVYGTEYAMWERK